MDEDAPTIPPTMDEDAAPSSANLAAIPDDHAATDRANGASIAAPTPPPMDDARPNSVGVPPAMDDIDAIPPDLANRVERAAIPADDAVTDRANSALSIDGIAVPILPLMDDVRSKSVGILPSIDGLSALPKPASSAGIMPLMHEGAATDYASSAPSMVANAAPDPVSSSGYPFILDNDMAAEEGAPDLVESGALELLPLLDAKPDPVISADLPPDVPIILSTDDAILGEPYKDTSRQAGNKLLNEILFEHQEAYKTRPSYKEKKGLDV